MSVKRTDKPLRSPDMGTTVQTLHQIWEEHAVGKIYDDFTHNLTVHTAFGEVYGRDWVVRSTLQQLAAFPNSRLRQVACISGTKADTVSIWFTRVADNTGFSIFGKPTGKRVAHSVAAQYRLHDGRIAEAWEVQDGLLLARQLGFRWNEALELAARWYTEDPPHGLAYSNLGGSAGQRAPSSLPAPPGHSAPEDIEALVRWLWHELWNRRRLDRIHQHYSPNYLFKGPSGRRSQIRADYVGFPLRLLASFPDAVMILENVSVQWGADAAHVAIRWRFIGTHEGPGFGDPTGKRVNLLGMTHQELRDGTFVAEKTLFDELSLLLQLRDNAGSEHENATQARQRDAREGEW